MRLYGFDWAAKVVERYSESDPRVRSCISYWNLRAAKDYVINPEEIVRGRMIFALRNAKNSNAWACIKRAADYPLDRDSVYEKWLRGKGLRHYTSAIDMSVDLFDLP